MFVHLHNHSDFSLLDGASSVEAMVAKAARLGMPGLALTDHGNLFGALKFWKACRKAGINPIVGSEFYVAGGSRFEKTGTENGNKYYHLVLLAKDLEGWANLEKLSSRSYTEGFYYKPRVDDELLAAHSRGLVCLSACVGGEIPQLIVHGKTDEAERKALRYREIFGADSFFLELQDHRIPEEQVSNKGLVEIARRHGIPLVATNDMHYLDREDAEAHDILLCVGTNKKVEDRERMRFPGDSFYLKTEEEMRALFPELPDAFDNTLLVNELCRFDMPLPGPLLPEYEIPPSFTTDEDLKAEPAVARVRARLEAMDDRMVSQPHPKFGKVPDSDLAPIQRAAIAERLKAPVTRYFVHFANDGLARRYPETTDEIRDRLDYELAVIILMDFVGYFLIVADFINWAKDRGIPVGPGRGSGAGSIVAYSLRITDIEPLRYNLLFERFLNPERVSMPDFDVDFCFERRGEVIDYVTEKYGRDRVGQIVTFGTLKAKAVIKDVARALDIGFQEANDIAKLVPDDPKMTLAKAFELEPKLRELEADPRFATLFETARKLENKNRHTSFHAAGIVIGKTPLADFVPLFKDQKTGAVATQYTMDQLEECGLVKMDFLGLKTLTLIKNAIDLVRKRGIDIDESAIPEDDAKTYAMLGEGKSTSVFQFESQGMQGILKQAKPNRMEDLIALNALYRPGPMDYIPQFIESKNGKREISYPHPSLQKYLEETYGVIVYQEQVMQVAQEVAGYSLGRADLLRRAMSKKKKEVLEAEEKPFVEGALTRGYTEAQAKEIFEILVPFAGYGFNKSHAAAYSVVAYRTAWLKANYPAEFMAANLTNEINDTDKLTQYISEARSMGLEIAAPDVNRSEATFTVVDGRIVYGLLGIKGVGEGVARAIVAEREKSGPYADFMDFLERVGTGQVNRKVLESLALAGCFDAMGHRRKELMDNLERAMEYAAKKADAGAYGQSSLFESSGEEDFPPFRFEPGPEFPRKELLDIEKQLLGFYFSGHPMDEWRKTWERSSELDLSKPERANPERTYVILGMLVEWREIINRNGKKMAFGKIEDFKGAIEVVLFSDALEKYRERFAPDAVLALRGKVDAKRDNPSLKVEEVLDPASLKDRSWREVHVRLEREPRAEEELWELRDLLFEGGGPCQVFIHVPHGRGETQVRAHVQLGCSPSPERLARIKETAGVADAWPD